MGHGPCRGHDPHGHASEPLLLTSQLQIRPRARVAKTEQIRRTPSRAVETYPKN